MSLISAEGYKNAGVFCLIIKETDELWVSMKDVGDGLGVKSISDIKKYVVFVKKKELTKEETNCYKMTEREIFKKFDKLSEDELNTKSNKNVFVKNTIMTNIIKHCTDLEKKEDIFEEKSVRIYEIDPYFSEHYKKNTS